MGTTQEDQRPSWTALLFALQRAQKDVRQSVQAAARHAGLSATEALLLLCCDDRQQGTTQQELINQSGGSAAGVSTQIEALRQRDLVLSHRVAHDRRRQVWQRTESGNEVAAQITGRLAEHLTTESFGPLRSLLQRLSESKPSSGDGRKAA